MRRFLFFLPLILLLAVLSACHETREDRRVLVCLEENGQFVPEENGLLVFPGRSACFELRMTPGTELAGADYSGEYRIWREGETTKLELLDVRFPTRVRLSVTSRFRRICYLPSGGEGEAQELVYDLTLHTRPNTANGEGMFVREGYTLTCWNTAPDGSGERVGLGSRVTVPEEGLTLYAQWLRWSEASDFLYEKGEGAVITAYVGTAAEVVIPERLGGLPVTGIAPGAFADVPVQSVVLPKSLERVEDGAFARCALRSLLLFDCIESISDAAFDGCTQLQTLHINAVEPPYGYLYRRESVYADKADLLIAARGSKKLVCYGGCSMWYNLNGQAVRDSLGKEYTVINMGLNGTVSSYVQMAVIGAFLEDGDIFFHTPELTSPQQMLTHRDMSGYDDKLWCGLENNYDLFALVDLREIGGVFDSLCSYLSIKKEAAGYRQTYLDSEGRSYMDGTGGIPFSREETAEQLADRVYLDPEALEGMDLSALRAFYRDYASKGVRVYVSYACVDLESVPEEQRGNVAAADRAFRTQMERTEDAVLISTLWDYLYRDEDFYDTVYHMCSAAAVRNTAFWLRDLRAQMERDGLWPAGQR